ncbi:hypothetical protein ACLMJK_004470 [Lecanora helva]
MHDVAPITSARSDEMEEAAQGKTQQQSKYDILEKRTGMWRAIILSSLGKTLFPYSKFIRTLRLQDLEDLLDLLGDPKLKNLSSMFFMDELGVFETKRKVKIQKKDILIVDAIQTSNRLTEVITKDTPMLEELSGNIYHGTLSTCIPRLPKLQDLIVYGGEALEDAGNLLCSYCPSFKSLKFYGWQHLNADQHLATFLNDIRPNSLESFEIISTSQIGAESFLALNCHRESLTELKLVGLKAEAIPSLSLLRGCTSLNSLSLAENGVATQDLEKRHNDVFLEVTAWLCACKALQTITITKLLSATGILTPVLLENKIKLTKLELEGYLMSESRDFHQALASQISLQALWLKGESSDVGSDVDILVESLSKLENLTDLRLREISDYFLDSHLCRLAQSLKKLETWWTSGYAITDAIWDDVASLHDLRDLNLSAVTRFTADGIVNYILSLGAGNRGLILNVTMGDVDYQLSEEDQSMIKDTINSHIGGRFDFMYFRGNEAKLRASNVYLMSLQIPRNQVSMEIQTETYKVVEVQALWKT